MDGVTSDGSTSKPQRVRQRNIVADQPTTCRSLPSISGTLSANPLIEQVTTLRAYMHLRTACRKLIHYGSGAIFFPDDDSAHAQPDRNL